MTATRKSRSTLLCHSFPPFYACYLLKSVQHPRATATYIGSTPNPPRRIRQHNGELSQGALKTRAQRPWVMQMIVHGFPSRLAALQFEWAWQHPVISRHLRNKDDMAIFAKSNRTSRQLRANIGIVRAMLSTHPYNNWPLHVTLFTEEAVRGWQNANKKAVTPLPPGFTCKIELEGVDGKSGQPGSGRQGPIDVKDELFTSAYSAKHTALLASKRRLTCSVCKQAVINYAADSLSTALCPTLSCTSVSHIICLATDFLHSQSLQEKPSLIPRGGDCKSCRRYVLWGDVIRGCYRRSAGDTVSAPDEELDDDDDDHGHEEEVLKAQDKGQSTVPLPFYQAAKKKTKAVSGGRNSKKGSGSARRDKQSSDEFFDLDGVSSSDEDRMRPVLTSPKRSQPPKILGANKQAATPISRHTDINARKKTRMTTLTGKTKRSTAQKIDSGGEWFDLTGVESSSDDGGSNTLDSPEQPIKGSKRTRTYPAQEQIQIDMAYRRSPISESVRQVAPGDLLAIARRENAFDVRSPEYSPEMQLAFGPSPRGKGDLSGNDSPHDSHDSSAKLYDGSELGGKSPGSLVEAMSFLSLSSPSSSLPRAPLVRRDGKKYMEVIELSD